MQGGTHNNDLQTWPTRRTRTLRAPSHADASRTVAQRETLPVIPAPAGPAPAPPITLPVSSDRAPRSSRHRHPPPSSSQGGSSPGGLMRNARVATSARPPAASVSSTSSVPPVRASLARAAPQHKRRQTTGRTDNALPRRVVRHCVLSQNGRDKRTEAASQSEGAHREAPWPSRGRQGHHDPTFILAPIRTPGPDNVPILPSRSSLCPPLLFVARSCPQLQGRRDSRFAALAEPCWHSIPRIHFSCSVPKRVFPSEDAYAVARSRLADAVTHGTLLDALTCRLIPLRPVSSPLQDETLQGHNITRRLGRACPATPYRPHPPCQLRRLWGTPRCFRAISLSLSLGVPRKQATRLHRRPSLLQFACRIARR